MKFRAFLAGLWGILGIFHIAIAQHPLAESPLRDIQVQIDTTSFSWKTDFWVRNQRTYLPLKYTSEPVRAEVRIYPRYPWRIQSIECVNAPSYRVTDTMQFYFRRYFRGEVEFKQLSQKQFPSLKFKITATNGEESFILMPVFPYTEPMATLAPGIKVMYLGQEVRYRVEANLPANIKPTPTWQKTQGVAYQLQQDEEGLFLRMIPLEYGKRTLEIPYQTYRPGLDSTGTPQFYQIIDPFEIEVKRGKIQYLDLGLQEIQLGLQERKEEMIVRFGAQVSLDLNQTYHLEDAEAAGSPLIADLFPTKIEAGGEMTGRLRVYEYHRRGNGNLYLKDGTRTLFTTNFDIIPKPFVQQVQIKRKGQKWTSNLTVKPGERFRVRIKGESLHRTQLSWEGLDKIMAEDSISFGPKQVVFDLQIPVREPLGPIPLLQNGEESRFNLKVIDYQRPQAFNFIRLETTDDTLVLSHKRKENFFSEDLSQTKLAFLPDSIDRPGRLMGLQYLRVEVVLKDPEQRILMRKLLTDVCICPSDSSPRGSLYDRKDCRKHPISIRKLFSYDWEQLPPWSRLQFTVAHLDDKYQAAGQVSSWEVIYKQKVRVEVALGFPVGLAFKRFDGTETQTFDGVHTALMAQFDWYQKGKINSLRPFRLGVGFMAMETFPFDGDPQQDFGVGALLSLYPTRRDQRISLPIYLGGGYGIQRNTWFFLVGPGLSIRLY